jgi:hypothetical protein
MAWLSGAFEEEKYSAEVGHYEGTTERSHIGQPTSRSDCTAEPKATDFRSIDITWLRRKSASRAGLSHFGYRSRVVASTEGGGRTSVDQWMRRVLPAQ